MVMDAHIEHARREIESATLGLTPEMLTRTPAGKWSSAQVLEHLLITYRSTTGVFERLKSSTSLPPMPHLTMTQRVGILLITVLGYFPEGRKAPAFTEPKGNIAPENIVAEVVEQLAKMDCAIAQVETMQGSEHPIAAHPVLGPLTAKQWRKFHLVHTRHHMKQVRTRSLA